MEEKEKETKQAIKKGGMYENIDVSKKCLTITILVLSLVFVALMIYLVVRG